MSTILAKNRIIGLAIAKNIPTIRLCTLQYGLVIDVSYSAPSAANLLQGHEQHG
jgi:hypothetical protein